MQKLKIVFGSDRNRIEQEANSLLDQGYLLYSSTVTPGSNFSSMTLVFIAAESYTVRGHIYDR